jgi:hypothetical protein
MNGAGSGAASQLTSRTPPGEIKRKTGRPFAPTRAWIYMVLRPTQRSPLFFDPGGMLMEAHDRAVDQALCRRGPSNATITSEALMTALADGRSRVPSANTDRGPK